MNNAPFHKQLKHLRCLDSGALALLDTLLEDKQDHDKGSRIIREEGTLKSVFVVREGWAIRYKTLADGRRQILNFLIPGDITGYCALLFRASQYSVEALSPVSLNTFKPETAFEAFGKSPRLAVAIGWLAGQSERQLDEQILRVGRRSSTERMAHLFMELHHRLLRVGMDDPSSRSFPITQTVLADALGLSHVHTNRSFRVLASRGLVTLCDGRIRLEDPAALSDIAGFSAHYLRQEPLPVETRQAIC